MSAAEAARAARHRRPLPRRPTRPPPPDTSASSSCRRNCPRCWRSPSRLASTACAAGDRGWPEPPVRPFHAAALSPMRRCHQGLRRGRPPQRPAPAHGTVATARTVHSQVTDSTRCETDRPSRSNLRQRHPVPTDVLPPQDGPPTPPPAATATVHKSVLPALPPVPAVDRWTCRRPRRRPPCHWPKRCG